MNQTIYLALGLGLAWLTVLTWFVVTKFSPKTSPTHAPSGGLRFSLVKFNPFSDTGGEQSFVISLLDPGGSGILLTSLHGRGITRLYAKRVVAGKVDLELSAEEKQALSQALRENPISYEK
jgi:hypothetical protein